MSIEGVRATTRFKQKRVVAPPRKKLKVPYIFIFLCLLPWLSGLILFTAYPMISSFYQSFTKFNIINPPEFIGLDNYRRMFFEDEDFM
jgi:ABC-type sugar transport system permease subunit